MNQSLRAACFGLLLFILSCTDPDVLKEDPNLPQIISLMPAEGYLGDSVGVLGSNLQNVDSAWVNGEPAVILSTADNSVKIIVPDSATSGPVLLHNGIGYSLGPDFTVLFNPLTELLVSTFPGLSPNDNFGPAFQIVPAPQGGFYFSAPERNQINYITEKGEVSVYAGTGQAGWQDGKANEASFNGPSGIDIDKEGNLYVADTYNSAIRKIAVGGLVSTLAGSGESGFQNGFSLLEASFDNPTDVAIDDQLLYISEFGNHAIRILNIADQQVTTAIGTGEGGFQDGDAEVAMLNFPLGIYYKSNDNTLIIADALNHSIRSYDAENGTLSTLTGNGEAGLVNGSLAEAQFSAPYDVIADGDVIYVVERTNHDVRRLSNGQVRTWAGTGEAGFQNGLAGQAKFYEPTGIAIDPDGAWYVCDYNNGLLRKIDRP